MLPCDTVYGIVCAAGNVDAAARLYTAKHREHKPGTVIAANVQQLIDLGLRARYVEAVEHFWPGPVSVIIPTSEVDYLRQGCLAYVRMSNHDIHELLLNRAAAHDERQSAWRASSNT